MENPDKVQNSIHYKLNFFIQSFKKTIWARLIVIAIQIVIVPLSCVREISILTLASIKGLITTMLFGSQILGLFISPKYYNQYNCILSMMVSFVSPHIYSHIHLGDQASV